MNIGSKDVNVGDTFQCRESVWTVLEYNSALDVVAVSDIGTVRTTRAYCLRTGQLKDYMKPTVWGIGIPGPELKSCSDGRRHNSLPCYQAWANMMKKVSGNAYKSNTDELMGTTYTVKKEWLYYPTFKEWFHQHWIEGTKMCLQGERYCEEGITFK